MLYTGKYNNFREIINHAIHVMMDMFWLMNKDNIVEIVKNILTIVKYAIFTITQSK